MSERQPEDSLVHLVGDKVRIRVGDQIGQRGVIYAISDKQIAVVLDNEKVVYLVNNEITNYSLAARRAWAKNRKRAGRPKSKRLSKKTVSLRVDSALWDMLGDAVAQGLISSRTQAIHDWITERLDQILNNSTNNKEKSL